MKHLPARTSPMAALLATMMVSALDPAPAAGLQPSHDAVAPFTGTPTVQPVSAADAALWREDLDHFARGLVERHANPFHMIEEDSFRALVAALDERIPMLARHEIIVEMIRIAAAIGDGHTNAPVLFDPAAGFHALPLHFGVYADGLYIEAGDRALGDAVGARVVGFGDIATEAALERLAPIVARDNDMWIRAMGPLLLARTEVLHALRLSDDPMRASLALEKDGRRWTQNVAAQSTPITMDHGPSRPPTGDWVDARDTRPETSPLYLKHADRAYWWEHLPERGLVYVHYGQTFDAPHQPSVRAFFDEVFDFIEHNDVDRLVIDVRHNTGGEGMLNRPVVRRLIGSRVNRPGGLFIVIGPRTFSAAQAFVQDVEWWTDAIFVGMPTGSSPRFYGDHSYFRLPNSGLLVSASPTWWQPGGPYDRRPFLAPDVAAEPTFADYLSNRDPAMDAILSWDRRITLADRVLGTLERGDTAATDAAVREWSADPANRYAQATTELNALGYRLLRDGRMDDALVVFRLNVRVHPQYANGWDSLGEALLNAGQHEDALRAYRRAFELDPRVGNAAEMVRRLGGGGSSH